MQKALTCMFDRILNYVSPACVNTNQLINYFGYTWANNNQLINYSEYACAKTNQLINYSEYACANTNQLINYSEYACANTNQLISYSEYACANTNQLIVEKTNLGNVRNSQEKRNTTHHQDEDFLVFAQIARVFVTQSWYHALHHCKLSKNGLVTKLSLIYHNVKTFHLSKKSLLVQNPSICLKYYHLRPIHKNASICSKYYHLSPIY